MNRQFITGMIAGVVVTAAVAAGGSVIARSVAASEVQTPAGAKYTSKVVFENARVRVKDVTFPAGVLSTGMHKHDLAHVGIILTAGSLVFTEPGKEKETVKFDVGSAGFRDANVSHDAGNPGKADMRVIEVELK